MLYSENFLVDSCSRQGVSFFTKMFIRVCLSEPVTCYKMLGSESNCSDYIAAQPPKTRSDWSGFYLQLNRAHALGTLGYRWDQGYEEANLLEITFVPRTILLCVDPIFSQSNLTGEEKAKMVKNELSLSQDDLLMDQIGTVDSYLCCLETELPEFEIIIPLPLLQSSIHSEKIIQNFKSKNKISIFTKQVDEQKWVKFCDDDIHLENANNVPPEWILKYYNPK